MLYLSNISNSCIFVSIFLNIHNSISHLVIPFKFFEWKKNIIIE